MLKFDTIRCPLIYTVIYPVEEEYAPTHKVTQIAESLPHRWKPKPN
ncbi:hypothetical protein SKM51_00505 [Acinetobacter faecalis]|uniref:Uncharacterized protein n=1 Tax=Acinetobacter faecalis TaxID=2665161 RepID=A0AB35UPI3_9GAMM|nr:hypothetical protein [Acinetobacter faecalis]MDY6485711.1 hypothetical protein [Acinetobacter faecalis]MDY6488426.1 hypothetical protein [Acinetobacter faecalis]